MLEWLWLRYEDLNVDQLYAMMQVRQNVFVVEQECAYLDADGLDQYAWHLLGITDEELQAYCRVVDPGKKFSEVSIGRILTTESARGRGIGRLLLAKALELTDIVHDRPPIRISGQQYLENYYRDFGFDTVSGPYEEDGIAHVEMLRRSQYLM